jgi:hypothetical protein
MALGLAFEEVVSAEEIATALKITEEGLTDLELKGLPFIEVGDGHVYLAFSILAFFKKVETSEKLE